MTIIYQKFWIENNREKKLIIDNLGFIVMTDIKKSYNNKNDFDINELGIIDVTPY